MRRASLAHPTLLTWFACFAALTLVSRAMAEDFVVSGTTIRLPDKLLGYDRTYAEQYKREKTAPGTLVKYQLRPTSVALTVRPLDPDETGNDATAQLDKELQFYSRMEKKGWYTDIKIVRGKEPKDSSWKWAAIASNTQIGPMSDRIYCRVHGGHYLKIALSIDDPIDPDSQPKLAIELIKVVDEALKSP